MTDLASKASSFEKEMASEFEQAERRKHPSGWEPHVEEIGDVAHAISQPSENAHPQESELIAGWNLDPDVWRIVGKVNCRRWQTYDERWLYYYKADLERIDPEVHADVELLYKRIRSRRPSTKRFTGDKTFLAAIGDTQIGKAPEGGGSDGTVERWTSSLDRTVAQLRYLRKSGMDLGHIVLAFLGDLGESCSGNYPSQAFTTDLTMREQDSLLQELVYETLGILAPLAASLDVITVPGNHGENRLNGKAFTLPTDNRDVAVIETVHRGIRRNENHAYDHVRFIYPTSQELTVCADLSGVRVAFAHGHQYNGGGTPGQKAVNWWKDQAHGMTNIGDASLLMTGHYHHLIVNQSGRKTHIQVPALDGGSQWWENKTAQVSPPGMVSMVIGEGVGPSGCGWDDLRVC